MPLIMRYRSPAPEVSRDSRPEFQQPSPDGLVADLQPALCQQILDIAVAQGEAPVQPNRVPDHIWREAVAGVGDCLHARESRRPTLSGGLTCQCPDTGGSHPKHRTSEQDRCKVLGSFASVSPIV